MLTLNDSQGLPYQGDGHTHTPTHAPTHARTHARTRPRPRPRTRTRTRTRTHTHTHTHAPLQQFRGCGVPDSPRRRREKQPKEKVLGWDYPLEGSKGHTWKGHSEKHPENTLNMLQKHPENTQIYHERLSVRFPMPFVDMPVAPFPNPGGRLGPKALSPSLGAQENKVLFCAGVLGAKAWTSMTRRCLKKTLQDTKEYLTQRGT